MSEDKDVSFTTRVPLDDAEHQRLYKAMNAREPIAWPGLRPRDGLYLVEGLHITTGSAWEIVDLIPA